MLPDGVRLQNPIRSRNAKASRARSSRFRAVHVVALSPEGNASAISMALVLTSAGSRSAEHLKLRLEESQESVFDYLCPDG